jgi:teichuronic acid biosynthesis glycosyltransferase TuaC
LRALVVSNMLPGEGHPERGSFVRDQVAALKRLDGLEVELHEFSPGVRALAGALPNLRRRYGRSGFDVVHAHFGLTAWPALTVPAQVHALTVHGTDLVHPRTRLATRAVLPRLDLVAAVSPALLSMLPGRARRDALVLPCGVDMERFRRVPRGQARAELGLDAEQTFVLFAADPARPEKRHDRALALAQAAGVPLRSLGGVAPERVPLWVNAANAVLVPSEREGFGLAVLEALACDMPVLATPVGVHPEALAGVEGALCEPFDLTRWSAALGPHLDASDPRIEGREAAMRFSAIATAEAVRGAWQQALGVSE